MQSQEASLPRVAFWLAILGSVVMVGIGARGLFDQVGSADAYGVPSGAPDAVAAWIIAAGVRDLTLGLLGLAFTLLRDRRALGVTALVSTVIPVVDGWLVLQHGPQALPYVAVHWGSALACLIFAGILLKKHPDT